jgi:hypothetical protein
MDFSTKTGIAKGILRFTVGSGTYKLANDFMRSHFVVETNWDRIRLLATTFALGGVAADAAKDYMDKSVDEAIEFYYEAKKWLEENKDKRVEVAVTEAPETTGP